MLDGIKRVAGDVRVFGSTIAGEICNGVLRESVVATVGQQGVTDAGISWHGNEQISILVLGNELSVSAEVGLENKRLLELRQETEKKMLFQAKILDAIQDIVVIISKDMKIIWGNHVAKKRFADSPDMFTTRCYPINTRNIL